MNKQQKHLNDRVLVYAAIWCISYVGSLFALQGFKVPAAAGIVLTAVTLLAFVVFIYKYYRSIFFMDEVQIKIHMEAVVIAFAFGLSLLMVLGLLDLFLEINRDDWSYRHLVPMLAASYFIGLFISQRKYQFK